MATRIDQFTLNLTHSYFFGHRVYLRFDGAINISIHHRLLSSLSTNNIIIMLPETQYIQYIFNALVLFLVLSN